MSHADFVHLRVHSAYSLAEGAIHAKQLVKLAKQNNMPAVAMTDSGNMFGALEFAVTASGEGVQPIVGVQLNIRRPVDTERRGLRVVGGRDVLPDQLPLIAQNEAGYRNLMSLVSQAFLDGTGEEAPQIALEDMEGRTEGLIALTGGMKGGVGRLLLEGRRADAEAMLTQLQALFPDRLYIELQRHFLDEENRIEGPLIDLAYARDLPLVATNDVFFADPGMHEPQDVLLCIAQSTTIGNPKRWRVTPHHRFKTAEEMRELFADLPEAIDNTLVIAKRCAVMPEKLAPILPRFDTEGGRTEAEELRAQAEEGLEGRLKAHVFTAGMDEAAREEAAKPYRERLDMELGVIESMGFPGYFLIVSDFIKWAKEQDIPVGPGRGSGAGSVVAWALTITDLDPLRFDLLFERFLNPERVSMPDFDVDFCQERRGEVIRYVRDKYGAASVAAIITFGTLQAKAVVRDVGRVMQMPYGQVDRLAKLIPFNPANPPKLQEAIDEEPKFDDEIAQDSRVGELLETALALEGLYRNAGTHAAGVVIGDRPLTELVPLYNDPRSDLPATQFNMKWAESAGLVKFDFLGLKTLTVIDRALKFIRRDGRDVGPEWAAMNDEATYDLMASGQTLGVFQLEGQGMRDTLRKVRPHNIEDVIAIISLYRPGPMDNIPVYVQGKDDPSSIRYQHPDLEPILEATYGVPVYQEQVMRMAQEIAGYSLGEADLLRRAMGKKKVEEMVAQRERFLKGAKELKGIEAPLANDIFDTMEKFAGYGFNKSHAAAYALIGYQTAYLKRHFPVEFLAASMSLDIHNTDKLAAFVQEAKRLKIDLIQPDINRSTADFDVQDGALVYALGALKGVGLEAMKHVEAERRANGPFESLHDFAERVDPKSVNKKCIEQLARAGAFDGMEPNRASALAAAPLLAAAAVSAAEDRAGGQGGLFGDAEPAVRTALPQTSAWNGQQKLDEEFAAVGFFLSGHPLDDVLDSLEEGRITLSAQIGDVAVDGRPLELIGVVRRRVEKLSRSGGKFAFLTLSDPTGEVELMVMPEALDMYRPMLETGNSVCVTVNVRRQDEEIRLSAKQVTPIDKARIGKKAKALIVKLSRGANYEEIAAVADRLVSAPGADRGAIYLDLPLEDGRTVTMKLPHVYATGLEALRALKMASGVARVDTRAA